MTKAELKQRVTDTGSHFFDHSTMKFFGDTMANFSCGKNPIEIQDRQGNKRMVFALWRKRSTRVSNSKVYYFDATTFEQVFPQDKESGLHELF